MLGILLQPVFSFKDHRLLVIAPHADDEVLGCGGLISRVKQDGGKVFVLIFNVGSIVTKNGKELTQIWKKENDPICQFFCSGRCNPTGQSFLIGGYNG